MKVLLVNPKTNIRYRLSYRLFNSFSIPLSLAYIAAPLEQKGFKVVIKDQYESGKTNNDIIKEIIQEKPDIVGFTCLANTLNTVRQIGTGIKRGYRPVIVAGNINAVVFAEELLRDRIVDIVVRGEGEYTMQELACALRDNKSWRDIQGISYILDRKVVYNADRQPIEDIDKLPYPAFHLFDINRYKDQLFFLRGGKILPVSVSRGCNYQCLFCSNKVIHKKFRLRSAENIAAEIDFLNDRYGVKTFGLVGSYFPINEEHTERFCENLIERRLDKKIKWFTESRVDKVNPALLGKMKEAGLYFIMYGCDFGTQKMLDKMHKRTTCQQAELAIKTTKDANIVTVSYFLLGGPGETKKDCEETVRFAKKLDSDIAKFNITVPYPGSPLFNEYQKERSLPYDYFDNFASWSDWSFKESDSVCDKTPLPREFVNLQRKAMFDFYFRPKILTRLPLFLRNGISIRYMVAGIYVMLNILLRMMRPAYQERCNSNLRDRRSSN